MTGRERPSQNRPALGRARPRVLIVGGGFAGVAAARALRGVAADVVLIDRRNHQIFQPLLYQVATAVLAPADVAAPIRQIAATQRNLTVKMAEVTSIDVGERVVALSLPNGEVATVTFDYLVLATGVRPSYFGHDEFAEHAPGLKTLADAETIRSKILGAYELAELTQDPEERERLMTFVLVGGGPTGVELAASIAQMAQVTLRDDFRTIRPADTRVILLEGGPRILPSFDPTLSARAEQQLHRLGVEVSTGALVEQIDSEGVIVAKARIRSATVLWTAGVAPSPLAKMLGVETDKAGRVRVGPCLEASGVPGVFVAGDTASVLQDAKPVPGVAQAAIQQGAYAGDFIAREVAGRPRPGPFRYFDKGAMAVVGKNFALLQSPRVRMSGFLTWGVWAFIHIAFLPRIQNRLRVNVQWLWSYFTGQRSSRLIAETGRELPRPAGPAGPAAVAGGA